VLKICLITLLTCSALTAAQPFDLKNQFTQAHAGDFIVTAQDSSYSLLRVRSLDSKRLILEEVSVPSSQVDTKTINWRSWLIEKAPGHTAWTLYEIDLTRGEIIECFSCSKNGWIFLDQHEQFFAKLFTLPFFSLETDKKKKIGPPPATGESDHRKIWSPPLIIDGKKMQNPHFDVLRTSWPDDGSQLSSCEIDLYFDTSNRSFPFPHWIEIQSPHYNFKIRVIESGQGLSSPVTLDMPHRSPVFTQQTIKTASAWIIPLLSPSYHHPLTLYAIDLSANNARTALTYQLHHRSEPEAVEMHINRSELQQKLHPQHRYQWLLQSDKSPSLSVRSDEVFQWL
jgi:hypothetical protein